MPSDDKDDEDDKDDKDDEDDEVIPRDLVCRVTASYILGLWGVVLCLYG